MKSPEILRHRTVSRRQLLAGGIGLGALLVAACGQSSPPSPTTAAQPASAPTPPAPPTAAATSGAAAVATPTTAAAAAAPTATAQPAAQAGASAAKGAPVVPVLWPGAEKGFIDKFITWFTQQHPDIKVEPVVVPQQNLDQKVDLMIAGGQPPSIANSGGARGYRYYAARKLALPLDPLVKKDNYSFDDFFPNDIRASYFNGSLQGLPVRRAPWIGFYNKTLFDKAKLPYPPMDWKDPNWTFDKHTEVAKALTVTENGKTTQYGTGLVDYFYGGWPQGWTHGGWWFNKDWVDSGWITKYTAPDDPLVKEGLQYWLDTSNKYHYAPTATQSQAMRGSAADLFATGKIAMWFRDTFGLSLYKDIKDFEWGLAAWPHPAKSQSPQHLGSWVANYYGIKGAPSAPETTWEFLKAFVSPEGQRIWVLPAGNISVRQSLGSEWINQTKAQVPKQADQLGVITDANAISYVAPDAWAINFAKLSDTLNSAVQKATVENGSADDIINGSKAKVEQTILEELKSLGYAG